jgi:hypothetical protein
MRKFRDKLVFLKSLDAYVGGDNSRFKVIGSKLYYVSNRVRVLLRSKELNDFDGLCGKIADLAHIMSDCEKVSRGNDEFVFSVGSIKVSYVGVDVDPAVYNESEKLFEVKDKAIDTVKAEYFTDDVVDSVIDLVKKENESFLYMSSLFVTGDSVKIVSPHLYLVYGKLKSAKRAVKIPLYVYKIARLLNKHNIANWNLSVYDNFVRLEGDKIDIICSVEDGIYSDVILEDVEGAIYKRDFCLFLNSDEFRAVYGVMTEMSSYVGDVFTVEIIDNKKLKLTAYKDDKSIRAEKVIRLGNKVDLKGMIQIKFDLFRFAENISVSRIYLSAGDSPLLRIAGEKGEIIAVV